MRWYWLPVILISFILSSCSSNSNQYRVNNSGSNPNLQPCVASFNSASPASICNIYWRTNSTVCDSQIRDAMSDRGLLLFPQNSCGQPISSVCAAKYDGVDSEAICDSYWLNKNSSCDEKMRMIMGQRGLHIIPRAACGTPILAGVAACSYDFSGGATKDICSRYWQNHDVQCDKKMTDELSRRGLNIFPREKCGDSVPSANSLAPVSMPKSCSLESIPEFVSKKPADLCKIAHSRDSCSRIARISLQGRSIAIGSSVASCGGLEKNDCATVIRKLESGSKKISAACAVRNDKTSLLGLKCRSEISGFLLNNNRSSGVGAPTCGQPLSALELEVHRKTQ